MIESVTFDMYQQLHVFPRLVLLYKPRLNTLKSKAHYTSLIRTESSLEEEREKRRYSVGEEG